MPSHVVLHSGGLDSTVALALACMRAGPEEVVALTIGYGQAHINELIFARLWQERWGVQRLGMILDPSPWKLLPLATGADVYAMKTGGHSAAFLPGRNVAFLSAALAAAGITGASSIWLAANADDEAGFPDCRREFVMAWQVMASLALDRRIELEHPLLMLTKRQIVELAHAMGIDPAETWSCYRPQSKVTGVEPCGRCDACRLRAAAGA